MCKAAELRCMTDAHWLLKTCGNLFIGHPALHFCALKPSVQPHATPRQPVAPQRAMSDLCGLHHESRSRSVSFRTSKSKSHFQAAPDAAGGASKPVLAGRVAYRLCGTIMYSNDCLLNCWNSVTWNSFPGLKSGPSNGLEMRSANEEFEWL